MKQFHELVVPALELQQGPGRKLYSFAVEGKLLPEFTTISRVHETNGHDIAGYQRPEVLSHIAEIRAYLESKNPMMPTNIVLAFDESVTFEPTIQASGVNGTACPGTLKIPLNNAALGRRMPGWIVDGQQRVAAIRDANLESFPVFVTGFIAASDIEQREQFILVNSPKPLSKDLIYELLPGTRSKLPALLQRRRFSASLLHRLNHDNGSPLKQMVRTPTNPAGVIKDNSILRMLENSLSDGALYHFRTPGTSEGDVEAMLRLLKGFWAATATVFEDAWGLPPRYSRLMHGAGIISMGLVMDAIAEHHQGEDIPTQEVFCREMASLREVCHWTKGSWAFFDGRQRKWNEIQNIPKDIQMLAIHLLTQYEGRVLMQ
ncbi:MAG: DGQHR domain-containing protein [Gammaproteobacteria bacterium]|nr:DGQHR domain-containing protein [Gammaproteobacteria bacterium]